MTGRDCDIAIVGGGLAGGLIALALAQQRPDLPLCLLEAGPAPGGNHRWSWFASDLSDAGRVLIEPLPKARWDQGYEVAFPGYRRLLATPYRSLSSHDFAAFLHGRLPQGAIRTGAVAETLTASEVTLVGGERLTARTVIDCRGFVPTPWLQGGWQVFLGRQLRTSVPHGVQRPMIMDAQVDQLGGYRFVYVLPLGEHDLFLEDTYYQDRPVLEPDLLSARLDDYCRANGWSGTTVASETGVLPVISGGSFAAYQQAQRVPGVAVAGARGGFVHPLTSYTLPFAAETALAIAAHADQPGEPLAELLEQRARNHWARTRFYRVLGAMLFGARPDQRRKVFDRFYRLDEHLIERFYAARSTVVDRARVLCGRPPVPITRALRALTTPQPSLEFAV
jgi:lycopene beta-cyclase